MLRDCQALDGPQRGKALDRFVLQAGQVNVVERLIQYRTVLKAIADNARHWRQK